MSEQDELRALRDQVAQLTGRVYRLEQLMHGSIVRRPLQESPHPNPLYGRLGQKRWD